MKRVIVEADSQLDDLIARAEAGDEVVITRAGEPVATISVAVDAIGTAVAQLTDLAQRVEATKSLIVSAAKKTEWTDAERQAFYADVRVIQASAAKTLRPDPRLVDINTLRRDDETVARLLPGSVRFPSHAAATEEERAARITANAEAAAREAFLGPDAAHSQDFLYDDYGLPA